MKFATSFFELNISRGCVFAAIPHVASIYFETSYGERRGPFIDMCRDGSCYELWVGRCYLVAERVRQRVA